MTQKLRAGSYLSLFFLFLTCIGYLNLFLLAALMTAVVAALGYPQINSDFHLFYNKANEENSKIINACPSIAKGRFYPTFYLGYGVLQAIFGGKSKYADHSIKFRSEIIKIPKNGIISLDWAYYQDNPISDSSPIILIIPGLTANCQEPYIKNICEEGLKNNYRMVIYNERHVGPHPDVSEEGFIRFEEDLHYVIEWLKEKGDLLAIGHSMGANILLKYLSVYNEQTPIKAAVSVANPFDLWMASKHIKGTAYETYVTKCRQGALNQKKDYYSRIASRFDLKIEEALNVKTAKEFDECFSRRLYGYPTVDTYYKDVSSSHHILNIKVPTLLIQSYDDPIIHPDCIPIDECALNKDMILLITRTGGHVGWFEGVFRPKRWFPKPAIEYLNFLTKKA